MTDDRDTTLIDGGEGLRESSWSDALPFLGERYRVLGVLGGGGMGTVYLADDTELGERVAVKVLNASLSERASQVEALRREVRFARKVTHPNVLRTFDIGDHDGAKFITMELVEGRTLAHLLPAKLPLSDVLHLGLAICGGLGAAHDVGLVHHDLKPSNVLLGDDGRILLSDFGVARLAHDHQEGFVSGTPGYMAPELLLGAPSDPRADIYALGIILFEMIVGARAFPARNREDLYRPLTTPVPDPIKGRPELPLSLARVVTRCLARQPDARFAHPKEVAAALVEALPAPSNVLGRRSKNVLKPRARVVAVLPLRAGDADDEYIAHGLTVMLTENLARAEILVPSHHALETMGDHPLEPLEVGRSLGAEVVVTGALSRRGDDAIRAAVTLQSTGAGLVLGVARSSRPLTELKVVAEELGHQVMRALLVNREREREGDVDETAIDLYLQGLSAARARWGEGTEEALALFARALDRAPHDPLILSAYARALTRRLVLTPEPGLAERVRAIAERAIAVARDRPEPHVARATIDMQLGDNVAAARAIRVAATLAPYNPDVQSVIGTLTLETRGVQEGIEHFYTVSTLDPSRRHVRWWLARAHALAHEWKRCDDLLAAPPIAAHEHNDYWINRARSVLYHPTVEREERFKSDFQRSPDFAMKRIVAAAVWGDPGASKALDQLTLEMETSTRRRVAFIATIRAEIAARRGDEHGLIDALKTADHAAFSDVVWLDVCPVLAPYRDAPDVRRIRERVAGRASLVADALSSDPLASR